MSSPSQPPQVEQAVQTLRAADATPEARTKAAITLIASSQYAYFPEIITTLAPFEDRLIGNIEWLYSMGYALVTHHEPARSIRYLTRTIAISPSNAILYTALTWAYLQIEDYGNAFLASSAGLRNCEKPGALPNLHHLAKALFQGRRIVSFYNQGVEFRFGLFTTNTQEIEAALHHLSQVFTEQEELDMLAQQVGPVEAIAEVGSLVGNHSVYFLKRLKPSRMAIIDASATSLEHTRANLELNLGYPPSTEIRYHHSAIGDHAGTVSFFGKDVALNSLSSLLTERYDFLKIDVDGVEMEALAGVSAYLRQHHPKVMIEVLHTLQRDFEAFLQEHHYRVIAQVRRSHYTNFLIGPQ